MDTPLFPHLEVHISDLADKPGAAIALVRRALQKAGEEEAATHFTEQALAAAEGDVLAVARRFVNVI
jgi:hypothetical protein